jgi:hypothetical protein
VLSEHQQQDEDAMSRPTDLIELARDIVMAPNRALADAAHSVSSRAIADPSELTDRELHGKQYVERERQRAIHNRAAKLLSDVTFVRDALLPDFAPELAPMLIESMRPNGDPTAFRTEVMRIVLWLAERQINVTTDDL